MPPLRRSFTSREALSYAFELVTDSDRLRSCMVEPEFGRLRFLAPSGRADALVERIYLEGGLSWSAGTM